MSELTLTEKQRQAIRERGKSILVSAAAGSGKTSVLSKRVVSLVEEGVDIRRILVCTFTNLAAGEMRERISRELQEMAESKRDARLSAQAEYAGIADICTIHKFAGKLIRENSLLLGIPADTRVGSDEESAILMDQAMEQIFEEFYEAEDEGFLAVRGRYAGRTDRALAELVKSLYAFANSRPEGILWLKNAAETDLTGKFRKIVDELICAKLEKLAMTMERCRKIGVEYSMPGKQLDKNSADCLLAAELKQAFAVDKEQFEKMLALAEVPRIESKLEPEAAKKELQDLKAAARKLIREMDEWKPSRSEQLLRRESAYMKAQAGVFYRILERFQSQYKLAKAGRKMLDYDDLINYAFVLLQDDEIAAAYAARYDYVFIDEYQDTNPVQEALLARISRQDCRFMVGDIKQSIYRFRLADPLIFLRKAEEFEGGAEGSLVIRMNENFRSAPGLIESVNFIMNRLMSRNLGEIEYNEKESLIPRGNYNGDTEILLTDAREEAAEGEEEADSVTKEAHTVARKITDLLGQSMIENGQTRPIEYGDICVLMRSTKGSSGIFAKVFADYGVPVESPEGKYAPMSEVDVFVNLMRLIDNANSDIALLSVLRSHIGGFDEAGMAMIRAASAETSFYGCFMEYAERQDALAGKCREFLDKIGRFRLYERNMRLKDLLIALKNETEYAAHMAVLPGGARKAANFRLFFEKCMEYASSQESLFSLVSYLDRLKRTKGAYYESKSAEGQANCVRIMSIHKSKGLEFPVVILARTSGKFNRSDLNQTVLVHSSLGIASDIIDEKNRTIQPAITKELFRYTLEKEMKSEELRILYVAMTRAKQKLVISGLVREPEKLFEKLREGGDWYDLLGMTSALEWILSAVLALPCMADWSHALPQGEGVFIAHSIMPADTQMKKKQVQKQFDIKESLLAAGREAYLPFLRYQTQRLPVKIGVSSIVQAQREPEEEWPEIRYTGKKTAFSGAEVGTLIHLFMQHLDFSAKTEDDIAFQAEQMLAKKLITDAEKQTIFRFSKEIQHFLQSDMAYRIRSAKRVQREIPFSLAVAAREIGLADSDESIVVQGIIDLFFEEDDGLVLLDYKSNMADSKALGLLADKYKVQLRMYEKALHLITGKPVKQRFLYFLRADSSLMLL